MKWIRKWKHERARRKYEAFALKFSSQWNLPYEGVLLLAGYRLRSYGRTIGKQASTSYTS